MKIKILLLKVTMSLMILLLIYTIGLLPIYDCGYCVYTTECSLWGGS